MGLDKELVGDKGGEALECELDVGVDNLIGMEPQSRDFAGRIVDGGLEERDTLSWQVGRRRL